MVSNPIPPFYEVARLTHESDEATLKACVEYRRTPPPEMSLSWLRQSDYKILSGLLSLSALENSIDKKLPPNARPSVKLAVKSLLDFSAKKAWLGEPLPRFGLEIGRGAILPIRVAGRFHSQNDRYVVGLQPRLDGGPGLFWQMQTWLALINEAYCLDPLAPAEPLILDVSRDPETRKRGFHAIGIEEVPLITRDDLNSRLDSFLDCWDRAVEIVPVRPRRERSAPAKDSPPHIPGLEP
jgi:hypothetical protein